MALPVGGCGLYGDFDRVRPSLATDEAHARIERDAIFGGGGKPSDFLLTDEERQLRDLGRQIIPPPYDRNRWESVFQAYVLDELDFDRSSKKKKPAPVPVKFDRAAYWKHLNEAERSSEASAYATLTNDAREDTIRIEPFFAIAARVADMDRRRDAFLAQAASVSAGERANARRRNGENITIVSRVCRALGERLTAYSFALERLVISAPSPMAVDGERALALLHARVGRYCRGGPQNVAVVAAPSK
jgi:hypothetical protein